MNAERFNFIMSERNKPTEMCLVFDINYV